MRKTLTFTIAGVILVELALAAYHVPIADSNVILIGAALVGFFALVAWISLLSHVTTKKAIEAIAEQNSRAYSDRAEERRYFYNDRAEERRISAEREREIKALAAQGFMLLYNRAGQPLIAQFDEEGQQLTRALPARAFGLIDEADYRVLSSD